MIYLSHYFSPEDMNIVFGCSFTIITCMLFLQSVKIMVAGDYFMTLVQDLHFYLAPDIFHYY